MNINVEKLNNNKQFSVLLSTIVRYDKVVGLCLVVFDSVFPGFCGCLAPVA